LKWGHRYAWLSSGALRVWARLSESSLESALDVGMVVQESGLGLLKHRPFEGPADRRRLKLLKGGGLLHWAPLLGGFLAVAAACETEALSPNASAEQMERAVGEAHAGAELVRHAVEDPALRFERLGVGVNRVSDAAEALRVLSTDARLSEEHRVLAALYRARALDDLVILLERAPRADFVQIGQRRLLGELLVEKAHPIRADALSAYWDLWGELCSGRDPRLQGELIAEVVDGLERYGTERLHPDDACAGGRL
jgi:hypothetical protein